MPRRAYLLFRDLRARRRALRIRKSPRWSRQWSPSKSSLRKNKLQKRAANLKLRKSNLLKRREMQARTPRSRRPKLRRGLKLRLRPRSWRSLILKLRRSWKSNWSSNWQNKSQRQPRGKPRKRLKKLLKSSWKKCRWRIMLRSKSSRRR